MKSLIESLAGFYDRKEISTDASKGLPEFGYSRVKISGEVILNLNGSILEVNPLGGFNKKTPTGKIMHVPKYMKTRTRNPFPYFLWDKTEYAFGIKLHKDKKSIMDDDQKSKRYFQIFKDFHTGLLTGTNSPDLQAFLAFISNWDPADYASRNFNFDVVDTNVVFKLEGSPNYLHELEESRRIWEKEFSASLSNISGQCLITGECNVPLSKTHPLTKGVRGAQSSGAALVSFNNDAFASWGKNHEDQCINSPISEKVAFKYTTALNYMLEWGSGNMLHLDVGDTTIVFWAEAPETSQVKDAETLFSTSIAGFRGDDETEKVKVLNSLKDFVNGRMKQEMGPDTHKDTIINILGLAPNIARIQVRFWHRGSFGDIADNLSRHYNDLNFDQGIANGWKYPPSIWGIVREASIKDREKLTVSPLLARKLLQSVISGKRYPLSFIRAILSRIRVERGDSSKNKEQRIKSAISPQKAAICKAFLVREFQHLNKEFDLMSLNKDNSSVPYLLGRLFAVYERAEYNNSQRNATVKDKWLSVAMSSPIKAFGKLADHNHPNMRGLKKKSPENAIYLDKILDEITGKIEPGTIPDRMNDREQSEFVVGYHHQRAVFFQGNKKDNETDESHQDELDLNDSSRTEED